MKQSSNLLEVQNEFFAVGGAFRLAIAAWFRSVLQ